MVTESAGFVIHRVVIALDSICDYLRPIEAAAELAGRLNAELRGVFVEDSSLLRTADLPFTRQVSLNRQATRPLERDAVEAEYRAMARQARLCLERVAASRHITWSFEVVKGDRPGYTPHTDKDELLVLESRSRTFAGHVRLPSLWSRPELAGARATALLGSTPSRAPRVLAILDESLAAERVLEAALGLVGNDLKSLTVLRRRATSGHASQQRGEGPHLREMEEFTPANLRAALRQENPGIAVLPLSLVEPEHGALASELANPPCTLLLVA